MFDQTGNTMLHKAAFLGHIECIMVRETFIFQVLLDHTNVRPDLVNGNLATPLHLACRTNRETVARVSFKLILSS
jgi:ankyrin repeat protein